MNQVGFNDCVFQIMTCFPPHLSKLKLARNVLQLVLLATFFWFFGLPALEKYQERKVIVVESWKSDGGILAPGVTIFAYNNESNGTFHGSYKNGSFEQVCSSIKGNDTMENCIDKNSNTKSDFLVNILQGLKRQKSLMSEQHIKVEFSRPIYGKYHSLDLPLQMSSNFFEDQVFLLLSHHFTYYFLIHDPNFFFGFYNPSFPMVREAAVNPNLTMNYYHFLIVTEVKELDVPEDLCQPDLDYSYQTCFKQSLSR